MNFLTFIQDKTKNKTLLLLNLAKFEFLYNIIITCLKTIDSLK